MHQLHEVKYVALSHLASHQKEGFGSIIPAWAIQIPVSDKVKQLCFVSVMLWISGNSLMLLLLGYTDVMNWFGMKICISLPVWKFA